MQTGRPAIACHLSCHILLPMHVCTANGLSLSAEGDQATRERVLGLVKQLFADLFTMLWMLFHVPQPRREGGSTCYHESDLDMHGNDALADDWDKHCTMFVQDWIDLGLDVARHFAKYVRTVHSLPYACYTWPIRYACYA